MSGSPTGYRGLQIYAGQNGSEKNVVEVKDITILADRALRQANKK